MPLDTIFEKETCTRCGGSGNFSWCQSHGSRCFKCGGKGETLTKRGAAASAFLKRLLERPITTIKVGDRVRCEFWYPAGSLCVWGTVKDILHRTESGASSDTTTGQMVEWTRPVIELCCVTSRGLFSHVGHLETMVRPAHSAETKTAARAAALDYQATLTTTGSVRKRKVAHHD